MLFKSGDNHTSVRAAKMKNTDSTRCWQGWKEIDPVLSWWERKTVPPLGKVVCQLLGKLKDMNLMIQQSHSWVFISEK